MKINPGVKKEIKRFKLGLPALNVKKRTIAEETLAKRALWKASAPERKRKRDEAKGKN